MTISINNIAIPLTIGAVTVLVILRYIFWTRVPKGLRLPPGPPGKFLIGNAHDLPTANEWETYSEWQKKYGDLVYLNVMGSSMLYVNSAELAHELFEKRSAIYSDRPAVPMLELVGWQSWAVPFLRYGEQWRKYRQALHQEFSSKIQTQYDPIQHKHLRKLLKLLLNSADHWESNLRHEVGTIIMEVAYGMDIRHKPDPLLGRVDLAISLVGQAGAQGTHLVNVIPQLKHLPEWLPGAGFLKKAKASKKVLEEVHNLPFQSVVDGLAAGTAKPSLTTAWLEQAFAKSKNQNVLKAAEEMTSHVTGTMFVAAAHTVASAMAIFVFAMILHPEAQLAAQKELDAVVGPHRLPSFEDRSDLPYIDALCKEVLRWQPPLPSAIPHSLMKDDIIGEYFIPAGTTVVGNAWGMLHSEATYGADAMSFKPERFLHSPNLPYDAAFGYGRRACPGRTMGQNALFIGAASILHVFNIVVPPGATPPDRNALSPGIIGDPMHFECNFVPRSGAAEALINQID